ncbi:MAG TPA: zinc ribbon domain-containing protein [Pyrinomonadaceae bacterium]
MSLIYCPECGHEISTAAVACPNCGRPLSAKPVVETTRVVAPVRSRDDGVPKWIFIPLGVIGAVLLLVFFVFMSRNSEDESNLNVNVSARRSSVNADRDRVTTTDVPSSSTVTVPPSNETQTVTVPGSQTSVTVPPSKGSVIIDAKIAGRTGAPQPVRDEKFYLLDKDVESILSEAGLEPIEGQTLMNSFGLSVMYPERFSEFNRDALRAIKNHIKYAGTTDSSGKAELGGVEPDNYYLFGITKSGRGFAIWSSPVMINPGQNALNLSPQRVTEMSTAPSD